jgi:hypothetical protein
VDEMFSGVVFVLLGEKSSKGGVVLEPVRCL